MFILLITAHKFSSQTEAAKSLNVSNSTVARYLQSGKVLNDLYLLSKTPKT